MAKDDLYIPHNSFLNCDKGAVPMQLVATPKKHNIYGLPIATESDNVPLVNIPCFGVCSINNSPCIPVAPEWKGVHGGAQKVLGKAPLLSTSYCKCQKGGSIKIFLTKKDAEAALADDKKSRVDGIPWLDDAIGNALLGPVGMVANKFFGSDDISQGVGRGFRKGLKGTLNFFKDDIWKADTWKGMGKMAGVAIVGYGGPIVLPMTPEKRLKAFDETFGTDLNSTHDAIGTAITQTWDEKVVNGTNAERSELAGQTAEMVFEAVLGSKGAGVVAKGTMAGAKMALGAERFTEITAAIAKLRQAVKLESLLNKVKGIFKVGEGKSAFENVYHMKSDNYVQGVIDAIDPKYFGENNRFANGFYVAEKGEIAIAEVSYHGGNAAEAKIIRFEFDKSKLKVLDLTDPKNAKKWKLSEAKDFENKALTSIDPDEVGRKYEKFQQIAEDARAEGYNAIKFESARAPGSNYVIYGDSKEFFEEVLKPQMVMPASN